MRKLFLLNLSQFDEGSVGAEGAQLSDDGLQADKLEGDAVNAEDSSDDSLAKSEETSKPSFEELIKGEYKEDYNKKMESVVKNRLKNSKDLQKKLDSYNPLMEALASRYGLEATSSPEDFINALMDDDRLYEDESLEKGIPVPELKRMKRMEMENETMRRQLEQESMRKENEEHLMKLFQEAEEVKEYYPDFDFDYESIDSPTKEQFAAMINAGVGMKNAYEVLHPEIQVQMMKVVADKTAEKVANSVKANKSRPVMADNNGGNGSPVGVDINSMSKEQLDAYIARATRERITFQ